MSTSATDGTALGTSQHPTYATWAPVWRWLGYVYEGSGPFLTGGAIIPHPREWLDHSIVQQVRESETQPDGSVIYGELKTVVRVNPSPKQPSPKLQERRRLARYENVASPIVDHKLAALLRHPPTRRVKGEKQEHDWLTWTTTDVDGAGTKLTDFMRDAERIALIFGHAIILADRLGATDQPKTLADQGRVVLRIYAPIDMPDWRLDDTGALAEVKLLEVVPRTSLRGQSANRETARVRYVDGQSFEVVDETRFGSVTKSDSVRTGAHGFGRLPAVVLYAKRRALTPLIGQSVLYDPMMHVDLHNLASELRELLRKQTFSILNVPLGATGGDQMSVDTAKALLGETTGTANVMFSGLPAQYLTADSANVTVYLEVIRTLLRTIYRLANVPFETDTRDAEAEGSLKLKREDMNQVLAAYADEMERTEMALAELWFRGTHGNRWEIEWQHAEPVVSYPETFDVTPFAEILEQAKAALSLPLGGSKTFMLELAKAMAPRLLPNASPETLKLIFQELEDVPTPLEERQQRMEQMATRFKDGPPVGEDGDMAKGVAPV